MTEPVVAYSVKEVLTRIEKKLDEQAVAIHQLQVNGAAAAAASRARAAIWTSLVSAIAAGAALLVAFTQH